jgi:type I restriction enzyme S subunit
MTCPRAYIVPASTPDETFELYSVPAFEGKRPEVVTGGQIGSNKQIVEPGTVLLCKINPRINRAWVVGSFTRHQKIASTEWITFPPQPDVEPRYLAHYLSRKEIRDYLAANASGVGGSLMRVKASTVEDLPFPLPNFDEQRRIVAEIEKQFSRVDEAVANLNRVKANLMRYRTSAVSAAFDGYLFSTDAAFPKRERAARRLPVGWETVNVGRILKVRGGFAFKSSDYTAGGVPVIRQTDLIGERVDVAGAKRLPDQFLREYSAFLIRKGDLLIGMSGSLGKISEYVWDEPALQNQRTGLLLINQGVSPAFARLVLKYVEPQILASGKGIAVQNVSAAQIEAATFPLPPAQEQARIVAEVDRRLSVVREVETEVDANLKRAQALRSAVLASAFRVQ